MGNKQSSFNDTVGIGGRESDTSSPDCFMIEPVPEGLEHVVYPKYEEAFRLGLEAFSNPVRVNKFKRPLPHILGTIEFQKQPHAGIVPTSKLSCSSGIPTPRNSPFNGTSSAAPGGMPSDQVGEYYSPRATAMVLFDDEEQAPPEDGDLYASDQSLNLSEVESVVSPLPRGMDCEVVPPSQRPLETTSSLFQFDGGLFEADNALSDALAIYRQTEEGPSTRIMQNPDDKQGTLFPETSLTSIRHQRSSSRSPSERSQMSRDLMQLGKNLSDLQSQRAAGNKANSKQ
eukprot:g6111.t1